MKWNYYEDYDGLTDEQVKEMSRFRTTYAYWDQYGKECMSSSKTDEKGPAGDYLKCYVTDQENDNFFQQTWIATVLSCDCF